MRVKTDAKRDEILKAAVAEFSERGFHETTLADVAKRMGSSKATIYNYYQTKVELFGAVLVVAAVPVAARLLETFERAEPFADRLREFARSYVTFQSSPQAIRVHRLLVSEAELSRVLTRQFREDPDAHAWQRVADVLRREQRDGILGEGDPDEMASQLKAVLHGDLPLRLLLSECEAFTEEEVEASADSATRFFLRAYARA